MTESKIAGAFDGGIFADPPLDLTDPDHGPEEQKKLLRLFEQAYWLGVCAKSIYAPEPNEKLDKEQKKTHVEKLMNAWNDAQWDKFFTAIEDQSENEATGAPDTLAIANSVLSEDWKTAAEKLEENDVDAVANALRRLYRRCMRKKYFYPLRWLDKQRLKDIKQANQKWEVAHQLWVQKAKTRIEGLAHEGENKVAGRKVKFGSKGGMEYFIAGDANLIILCFRGTEPKFGDIVTDLFAWQSKVGDDKGKVHDGFWSGLDGVWVDLRDSLTKEFMATKDGFPDTQQPKTPQLWITGHSLGGALATLAAYRLVYEEVLSPEQIGGVFTFGQPRVGDSTLSKEYKGFKHKDKDDYLNDRHFRFVNNNDIVTTVPPKSLWLASVLLKPLLTKFFGPRQENASGGGESSFSFEYSDLGRVVLANRSRRFKLLTPPRSLGWKAYKLDFWWPVRRWTGRIASRLRAPFMGKGFGGPLNRFLPGIADHFMDGYVAALKNERDLRRDADKSSIQVDINKGQA